MIWLMLHNRNITVHDLLFWLLMIRFLFKRLKSHLNLYHVNATIFKLKTYFHSQQVFITVITVNQWGSLSLSATKANDSLSDTWKHMCKSVKITGHKKEMLFCSLLVGHLFEVEVRWCCSQWWILNFKPHENDSAVLHLKWRAQRCFIIPLINRWLWRKYNVQEWDGQCRYIKGFY